MNDPVDSDASLPSASGILDCLRMLAQEAAELDLAATLSAIEQAMNACRLEAPASILPSRRFYH